MSIVSSRVRRSAPLPSRHKTARVRQTLTKQVVHIAPDPKLGLGQKKKRIQSVQGFVDEHFFGDLHAFRKHYGLVMQRIKRWISTHAIICENGVYLRKSKFEPKFNKMFSDALSGRDIVLAPLLDEYIEQRYQGNMTAFADDKGTRQQQVYRWTRKAECLLAFNEVYRLQEELRPVV